MFSALQSGLPDRTQPRIARRAIPTLFAGALRASVLAACSLWLLAPHGARAQGSPPPASTPPAHDAPAGQSFENYRMVRTRNVFDPDRRAMTPASSNAATAAIKQSDYVALTGTLLNAGKALAFFSGSRADFNRVLGVSDKIAGAAITNITAAGVEVDRGGKKVTVAVGQTVPLDGSAPTSAPVTQPLAAGGSDTTPPAITAGAAGTAATANSISSKQQEIMQRMMEKRKQDGLQ